MFFSLSEYRCMSVVVFLLADGNKLQLNCLRIQIQMRTTGCAYMDFRSLII